MTLNDAKNNYKENGGLIVFKEWLLAQILRNKVVLFENKNREYERINDIYFDDGVVVCKKTDFVELKE